MTSTKGSQEERGRERNITADP